MVFTYPPPSWIFFINLLLALTFWPYILVLLFSIKYCHVLGTGPFGQTVGVGEAWRKEVSPALMINKKDAFILLQQGFLKWIKGTMLFENQAKKDRNMEIKTK